MIAPGNFSGQRRLQIYRNNVFASLTEALRDVFPVVARLVGEGFFSYAAHEYIVLHPSRTGNLHDFGAFFSSFLQEFQPAQALPYLPDIATLEWAWHGVFHAADHPPLSLDDLAQVPPERYPALRFRMTPASRLVSSDYPILRIWQVNQEDFAGEQTVDLDSGGDKLLAVRPENQVVVLPLSDGEFELLNVLAGGDSLDRACEAALAVEENLDIPSYLRAHVLSGALVGFES